MANYTRQIDALHKQLNSPDVVSARWYRRNTLQYPLLCYVNIIIGLYYSANYAGIPIFISRAYEERQSRWVHKTINGNMPKNDEWEQMEAYILLLDSYLTVMTHFLDELDGIADSTKALLPEELRRKDAG